MWLEKLFGRKEDDSEPAEFPRHPASDPISTSRTAARPAAAVVPKGKGFDPYNSGAFRKASAWERVSRR